MKKFITFTLCLLLCVVTLGLAGCGGGKKETVDTSIASNGNGGMVVTRGDYVYFVNGYTSYQTYTKDNLDTKFDVAGLYRAKLNANGELDYDDNGSVSGAEKLSSNLVGFETTSLYVFGNHIYYTTPITEVNKKGELQTSKIEFRRIKITGGKAETVYQAKVDATNIDFEFYYAEGKVYLVINEDGTLKRVNCFDKFSVTEIASDVTSVSLPRDADDVFESDSYKNIFYTKTNDDGNIEIYNYNIATGRDEYKKTTDYATCELLDYKFGHLYYKASREQYPSYTYYYRIDATKNAITSLAEEKLTSDNSYTNFYFLDNETSGYIAQNDNKTYYLTYNAGGECDVMPLADSKLDIIAIKNNYMYFNDGGSIKRINCYEFKLNGNKTQETIITLDNIQTYSYDIDSNNLYVYATSGDNTYLYSIKVGNILDGETVEAKLLGVYNEGDAPEVEE